MGYNDDFVAGHDYKVQIYIEPTSNQVEIVEGAIKQLDEDMDAAGCSYLGEFYYKLFLNGEKIRTGDG